MKNKAPVILDFDNSVGLVEGAARIDLNDWQETVRFGCSLKSFRNFTSFLQTKFPSEYGTVLTGSGDFHHLSWPLIELQKDKGPFQVILFDNHPDNMRFPFGIHCGSWVNKVASLPYVSHVHVLGVTSSDISFKSIFEQYWSPLLKGKLTYWCMDVNVKWASYIGLGKAFRRFDNPDELIKNFILEQKGTDKSPKKIAPTYLTIDKDVLSITEVNTNWDQGRMLEKHIISVIEMLSGNIIGSDITGDVSVWHYNSWWKKKLSALDGQQEIPQHELQLWQRDQQALNQRLLTALSKN